MNKVYVICAALIICIIAAACSRAKPAENDTTQAPPVDGGVDPSSISAYAIYPENAVYIYEGDVTMMGDWTVYHDYVGGGKAQKRFITDYASTIEVLKYGGGALTQVYGIAIANHEGRIAHADYREHAETVDVILLKEPIKAGNKWVQSEIAGNGVMSEITAVGVSVTVPYGTFDCVEVTTVYQAGYSEERDYYAPGVGLVKVASLLDGEEVISELSQILQNQTVAEPHGLFFPENGQEGSETISVAFATNEQPQEAFAKASAPVLAERFGLDFSAAAINGVSADPEQKRATVDFAASVLSLINKTPDAETEQLVLQCAADSFGYLLGADEVRFLIDGQAYKSDKFALEADDYIQINMTRETLDE